jgi:4'-phosphopantetheinyl transferase EntD
VSAAAPCDASSPLALDDLFDAAVRAAAAPIEASIDDLLPEERPAVLRAVGKRQREFATARRAARGLLAELGFPGFAILRNDDRTPAWPAGIVGSISHCDDLCAVVLARAGAIAGLGVDVEPDQPLDAALWSRICTPREIETIVASRPTAAEQGRAARLVFCAKEAFYKSVYPSLLRVLGFHEVEIQVDWRGCRFLPHLQGTHTGLPDGARFEGRFARRGGFLLAGATLWTANGSQAEGTAR